MSDSAYFKMYAEFQAELRVLAECRAKLERLDALGVPQGSLMFSTCHKEYKCRDGSVSVKDYTNLYLYYDHEKHYISRKDNKDGVLQFRLALRSKIMLHLKNCEKSARIMCNTMNACKPRGKANVDFDTLMETEYVGFVGSDQYALAISEVDCEFAAEKVEELYDTKPEFKNEIYFNDYKRLRSKNELITALCLSDAGISYIAEPRYPGVSNYCSDFAVLAGDRRVFVEIAGMMSEPEYKERMLQKRKMAVASNIPIVIIDMTDYADESGRRRTRLRYDKLKKIFLDIKLGIIKGKGEILKAY